MNLAHNVAMCVGTWYFSRSDDDFNINTVNGRESNSVDFSRVSINGLQLFYVFSGEFMGIIMVCYLNVYNKALDKLPKIS